MLYALILFAQEKGGDAVPRAPGFFDTPLPLFLALAILFLFVVVFPQRKAERRQREELITRLKNNDEVITSSGIIGIVTSIKEGADEVTLKSDETRLRVLKSSIVRIVSKDTPKEGGPTS